MHLKEQEQVVRDFQTLRSQTRAPLCAWWFRNHLTDKRTIALQVRCSRQFSSVSSPLQSCFKQLKLESSNATCTAAWHRCDTSLSILQVVDRSRMESKKGETSSWQASTEECSTLQLALMPCSRAPRLLKIEGLRAVASTQHLVRSLVASVRSLKSVMHQMDQVDLLSQHLQRDVSLHREAASILRLGVFLKRRKASRSLLESLMSHWQSTSYLQLRLMFRCQIIIIPCRGDRDLHLWMSCKKFTKKIR